MTMDENLRAFMQDYHSVLNAQNFEGLAEFLDFPFEIALKGKTLRLHSIEEAIEAFRAVHKIHLQRGVTWISRNVYLVHPTSLSEAIIGTDETAYDQSHKELVNWRSSYLMRRINGIWKLTLANAVDHDKAWQAKGERTLQAASASSLC